MNGYTKLFGSIIGSTIWGESKETKIVWITMLALVNRDGIVEGSIPGLARFAQVTVEECEVSLERLSSPDKYSKSKEHDGRRIKAVDGGWLILNHAKYRDKMSAEDRREKDRIRQQNHRKKGDVTPLSRLSQHTDTDSEPDSDTKAKEESESTKAVTKIVSTTKPSSLEEVESYAKEIHLPIHEASAFYDHFESNGWKVGGKAAMKDWRAALRNWHRRWLSSNPGAIKTPPSATASDKTTFMGRWTTDNPPTPDQFTSQSSYENHLEKFNKWKAAK